MNPADTLQSVREAANDLFEVNDHPALGRWWVELVETANHVSALIAATNARADWAGEVAGPSS